MSMAMQEKSVGTARRVGPKHEAQAQNGQGEGQNGELEQHSRLGQTLGRAGTAVGDSLTGLTRRGNGDGDGRGESSGGAPKAATAAAVSAVATLAGRRLLERPRRRVAGIPLPGTRRPRRSVAKDLARRLPGVG
jgi:hypothetical protein